MDGLSEDTIKALKAMGLACKQTGDQMALLEAKFKDSFATYPDTKSSNSCAEIVTEMSISRKASSLPGYRERVDMPCSCSPVSHNRVNAIGDAIIWLNDNCGWSREQIADWLDDLADKGEINIDF